ncbi:thiamine pyrophosphate-binding protein [Telmatospirillum siberiense]|uniref:Thiamine pyrophosphate-binding protein n=1 Tax=Telmatospirillum siberiense TaxID=382514 RepID=A0A2N3PXU0_9PROT|nr:thiamine pyrophosphate-binding protein [Telmatospirillum siberiense]PKU25185.1 thiamine pyrophosphate-binding protein [Telmatospirillum siberiense]
MRADIREPRTGGAILADALLAQGVDMVFSVPGESFIAFLDAAYDRRDRLDVITCRHEGSAAYMAEAYGKLTARPGVCYVTRGPGACNAALGVHTAFQDSTPMVLLIGQVKRALRGREAYQEVEFRQMYGALAKQVEEVSSAARIPEAVARAFAAAVNGRPGPVVLALPQDVLEESAQAVDPLPVPPIEAYPGPDQIERLLSLLRHAKRPLAVVGGPGWSEKAAGAFTAFAEAWRLPVASSFRCQDIIDNNSPVYVGELGTTLAPFLGRAVRDADLLLVVGARFGEVDSRGYELLASPTPHQILVHVFPAAEELGRVFQPQLGIAATVGPFVEALAALGPPVRSRWEEWSRSLRDEQFANRIPEPCAGALDLGAVIAEMARRLPEDAIICHGAGNYTGWVQRYYPFRRFRTQISPVNGSMGYGVPAALAAKLLHPHRPVIAFAGDGCFLMASHELATAVRYGLDPLVVVINNGIYGTIRAHQERCYPGRSIGTDLTNPDFAALARAYGAEAETVERTEDFIPAFERLRRIGRLALLELKVDPEAISTRASISALRAAARSG